MAESNLTGKTVLGGYLVTEVLGSGAFGTVYKAIKKNPSGEYVRALKHMTIPSEKQYESVFNSMGGDLSKVDDYFSEMLKNIVTEIQILNDFSEKGVQNIVRYYENDIVSTESPKRYNIFILMEYLTPLSNYISQTDFTVKDVVQLGSDVLKALALCHDGNVIHRDIKDDNIFVSANGEFKVGDFGVSKVLKDSSKAESLKGTPNFLAPEVYLGKEGYTKSADLYSLGIVLYRLLNYSRNPLLPHFPKPYGFQDEERAFDERMQGNVPDLPSLGGNLIGNVILKAVANENERYSDAVEFFNALEAAAKGTSREILDTRIKAIASSGHKTIAKNEKPVFSETVGENVSSNVLISPLESEPTHAVPHSDLFNTFGHKPNLSIPEISNPSSNAAAASGAKKGGNMIKNIAIAVLLLVLIAGGGFFVLKTMNAPTSSGDQNYNSVTMENNETAAIAGLMALGSGQSSYSNTNNGRYTSISGLIEGGFIDVRYDAPFDGYIYGMSITSGMPENVPVFGAYGVFIATPTEPGGSGRYRFGLGSDMAVRYMGLAEGVTAAAPICGNTLCNPGDVLGKTQPAPPTPTRITLTAGTPFKVSVLSDLSTMTVRKDDEFDAVLSENITIDGYIVARRDSIVKGMISSADSGGPAKGPAKLSLLITKLTLTDGQMVSVITNEHTVEGYIDAAAAGIGIEAALNVSRAATGGGGLSKRDISKLAAAQSEPAIVARETPITFRLASDLTVTMKK